MKSTIFCSAVLLSASHAMDLKEVHGFQIPQGEFPIAPLNGFIHMIYCNVYGEDPEYGPCSLVDSQDRIRPYVPPSYPEG